MIERFIFFGGYNYIVFGGKFEDGSYYYSVPFLKVLC